MKYDVTIGIPMYNVEDFIERTMESVLSQLYSSIEFLIVDDGSLDDSVALVKKIIESHLRGEDIRLICLPQNQGPSFVRNLIIEEARGDYLFFMDADDVIKEDAISLMMESVQHEKANIVFGSMEILSLSGNKRLYQYPRLNFYKGDDFACYAYRKYAGIQASACNILFRVSTVKEKQLKFYDSNYWEDFAFVLDLVTCYSHAVLLPNITYTYLCRSNSLSNFQYREYIDKSEIHRNVGVADYMKSNCIHLRNRPFYPERCYISVMTDFYIACTILKQRKKIVPMVSDVEIKSLFTHPATFNEICSFNRYRFKNLFLYFLGKLPSFLCVLVVMYIGKMRKLI